MDFDAMIQAINKLLSTEHTDSSSWIIKAVFGMFPVYLIAYHTPFLLPHGGTGNHRFFQCFRESSSPSMSIAC